tara:strand:- start:233 stop:922 length:690 start_codon:yes stop_codon:yes gene_type:complete
MPQPYTGNILTTVTKESKYSVAHSDGEWSVRLRFVNEEGYKDLYTHEHDDLVDIVNEVKREVNGRPGGAFKLDEYRNVVIPTSQGETFYHGGKYPKELIFDLNGREVGASITEDLDGISTYPGAEWKGPRTGMRYTLTASGDDIKYERVTANGFRQIVFLRKTVGDQADATVAMLSRIKPNGGRFMVNECGHAFAMVEQGGAFGSTWEPFYAGKINLSHGWFPDPHPQI